MRRIDKINKLKLAEILNRLTFFAKFSIEQREVLLSAIDSFYFCKKGFPVQEEGELSTQFYLILSGTLVISKSGSDKVLGKVKAGEFIGEGSFIGIRAKSATARAEEDVIVMAIERLELDKLPSTIREKFKDAIIEGMAKRIVYLSDIIQKA
ncbi:hypothetical protein C2869_09935 [Saccharobesus litoralis]|uniref:Cyclic nucleotide-binding domain-containing protein n=1 Tax=Saccharobesus litoralis TaxID=2172099 RepID=A0A2S0VR88_9ALTE|nr:cyclic nucleotide-binding domain-containing protein [Saccharobesus litoralis]AWB66728.1 hypothetical protein C2869_09935 [Saccharobesus litoralis]